MQLACQKTHIQGHSSDFKQFFLVKNNFVYLLTSVHNDADTADDADAADNADATDDTDTTDDADNADDANDYTMVIGIALLKAFNCPKKNTVTSMLSKCRTILPSRECSFL